jgi:malate dehydrogenase (quinone)
MAEEYDVLLIGAGIMSATLGTVLKRLDPTLRIAIFERLEQAANESSEARNNAGTGHAALCELNYTPEREDGSIDVTKAFRIMESFEVSKQAWASLVEAGVLPNPQDFIRPVPHLSFVWGERDVDFLRRRYEALTRSHLFASLRYTEDVEELKRWMPLVMHNREPGPKLAATSSSLGTDVDFGELTRGLVRHLERTPGVKLFLGHHVAALEQGADRRWRVRVQSSASGRDVTARFVFIGAGGGALDLLEASGITEGLGHGGFPVSGEWLVCTNPQLIQQHWVKVYGKAKSGAPPMSVPHLDRRYIAGKPALIFGPFAGFSTKFLKEGSYLDLPGSVTVDNLLPMLSAGLRNLGLTKYLLGQVTQSLEDKVEALREFIPHAAAEEWQLEVAGQRVQLIKKEADGGGRLEFGTEIISCADHSLAALLGASPGASISVSIALDVLARCFPDRLQSAQWQRGLAELIPSWGRNLADDAALTTAVRDRSSRLLRLDPS